MRENALGTVEGDYTREVSPLNLYTFSFCTSTLFFLLSPYFILVYVVYLVIYDSR